MWREEIEGLRVRCESLECTLLSQKGSEVVISYLLKSLARAVFYSLKLHISGLSKYNGQNLIL